MKKYWRIWSVVGLLCGAFSLAPAWAAKESSDLTASIKANLRKNLGSNVQSVGDIQKTPMAGVYQVVLDGRQLVYTDATGSYILQGSLFDLKNQRNLTQDVQEKLSQVDFAKLPFADAFTIVRGNGKRKMAVFEDPNCGYCKKLDAGMKSLSDVTIYVFIYPVLGEKSLSDAKAVWCSKDRAKTWMNWMVDGVSLPSGPFACDTSAIARNVAWGQKHAVRGTPTLFFENGVRKGGAVPLEVIEKYLNGGKS